MIKGILFDKDGTLIEFIKTWHTIMGLVFDEIHVLYTPSETTLNKVKGLSGYLTDGLVKESNIQHLSTTALCSLWTEILNQDLNLLKPATTEDLMHLIDTVALEDSIHIHPLPGVMETLEALKLHHIPIGIATADTKASTMNSLKKSGLFEYMGFIGCDDGICQPKPHPQMAYAFCHHVGIDPSHLMIVGDSLSDYRFAKNAGAQFLGLHTPYNSLSTSTEPITLLQDIRELLPMVL